MPADPASDPLRRTAVLQLILTTAAWALSFPVFQMLFALQKACLPDAPRLSLFLSAHAIAVRSLAAAAIFLLFNFRVLRGLRRSEWLQGALLGLFGGTGLILQADGLHYTSAPVSAFLTQFYCVLLPAWMCLRRRTWLPRRLLVATLLVVAGISVLSGLVSWKDGGLRLEHVGMGRGEIETLLAAVFFTVQILLLEKPAWKEHRMVPVTVVMFLGFALCAVPAVFVCAPSTEAVFSLYRSSHEWLLMAVIVVFCTVYAYSAMNRWQPHVTATEGGLIYCLEPVFTSIYALFLPAMMSRWTGVPYANETLTTMLLIGGGLITAANIALQFPAKRRGT
jgi:drug/metabolite transporter (DMT)-like permease